MTTATDTANGYIANATSNGVLPADWRIFPCHFIRDGVCSCGKPGCESPGKHSRTPNGLLDATNDQTTISEWWACCPQANRAVLTGEKNGIVVVDIDSDSGGFDALLEIEQDHGRFPETLEVRTPSGGIHLYFRYPAGVKIGSRNGWRKGIDIKGDGDFVLAPPSNHVKGVYCWEEGASPGEATLVDLPSWLLPLLPRREEKPADEPNDEPRDNHAHTFNGDGRGTLLHRAGYYVDTADTADEGMRSQAAFRLAGHLATMRYNGSRLSERDIFDSLRTWNARCNPPLDEGELQACVDSALKNGKPQAEKEASHHQSHDRNGDPQSSPKPLDKFTLAQLCESFPELSPPVVNGLFRQGETCNIISHSKAGKSWLLYGLMLSQITKTPWLGHETSGGRVLICDNELHPSTLAHRIPAVGAAMELDKESYIDALDVIPLRGKLRSFADIVADFDAIKPGEYSIIGFDAKYRFILPGVSENDNAAETLFYNLADQLATRTGAALVFIHHASKGLQGDKRVTDVGSGAGAQSRAADCHIILREHEEPNVAVMDAALRSFAPVKPLALRWTFPLWQADEQLDPTRLKRQPTGGQQQQADRDRQGVDKIIKALRAGPATARQLRPMTGISPGRQQRLLDWMASEHHVTITQITIRGNKCDEYSLVESPS